MALSALAPSNIPGSLPVVPGISLGMSLVSPSLPSFLERSFDHDHHCSDRLLYDAGHRSQDLTSLAPPSPHAAPCPSHSPSHQLLNQPAHPPTRVSASPSP